MDAIKFQELHKKYREGFWGKIRVGLEGVSFSVPQGGIFGFLGANGAGKTTAIKIALGLQRADSGGVEILGAKKLDSATKARLGYLPERPYLHQNLSAAEFLNFHRSLYGSSLKRGHSNEELLEMVGLSEAQNVLLRNFSKGMLQRIGIAQSLLNNPELVILDEPMSGLDPVGRREVRNLLFDLNRRGKTIFFSSHILSDIESICQRIAFLEKGKLKYFGGISELLSKSSREAEVLFRGVKEPLAGFGQAVEMGEWKKIIIPESSARAAVEAIWQAGGEIKSFTPVHASLEEALFGDKK
jgi:ABC-2 type transport system ATP-binding protein